MVSFFPVRQSAKEPAAPIKPTMQSKGLATTDELRAGMAEYKRKMDAKARSAGTDSFVEKIALKRLMTVTMLLINDVFSAALEKANNLKPRKCSSPQHLYVSRVDPKQHFNNIQKESVKNKQGIANSVDFFPSWATTNNIFNIILMS